MKIYITADNIEHGVRGCESSCPLALAFKDAGFTGVSIGDESIALWDAEDDEFGASKSYSLTESLIAFIVRFDDAIVDSVKSKLNPMEFEFDDLVLIPLGGKPNPKTYTELEGGI